MGRFMVKLAVVWNFEFSNLQGILNFLICRATVVYGGVGSGVLTKLWPTPTDIKTPAAQPAANSYNLHVIGIIWSFGFSISDLVFRIVFFGFSILDRIFGI